MAFVPDTPSRFVPDDEPEENTVHPYVSAAEAIGNLATGAIAAPLSGLAGLAASALPGGRPGLGKEAVEGVQNALTYQPRSPMGQKMVEQATLPFQLLAEGADIAGGATTDATGSPLAGAAVNTAIQALPLAIGGTASRLVNRPSAVAKRTKTRSLNAPADAGVQAAREAGYVMTPSQAGGGKITKLIEGVSGEPKLAKLASEKNAAVTNALIRKDVGLPEDVPLSRNALANIRKEAGKAYEAVKQSGTIKTDVSYLNDLASITKSFDTAAADFAHRSANPFSKVMDGLKKKQFDASSAVEEVKLLRSDADTAYAAGDKSLGKAFRGAAQALDDQILRHLQRAGPTKAHADYIAARQKIAKTYAADKALNDTTGNINAAVYAKEFKKGRLTGEGEKVGRFAAQFPREAQQVEKIGSTGPTLFDLGVATLGREALLLGARPVARHGLLTSPVQKSMAKRSYGPGIWKNGKEAGLAIIAAEQIRRQEEGLPPLKLNDIPPLEVLKGKKAGPSKSTEQRTGLGSMGVRS